MIRAIVDEVVAGYRWPEDWNRYCHTLGFHEAAISPEPPIEQRVHRALVWGFTQLRVELASVIDPDA